MRSVLDLVGVAISGLTAKLTRTLLIMPGPIIGGSAIVAAVGLTESAKGDLQQTLSELGTNLITAGAAGSFGAQDPRFPEDVVERAEALTTVEQASAVLNITSVITIPYEAAANYYTAFPIPVLAADQSFPEVIGVELTSGRRLNSFDDRSGGRSVVIGTADSTLQVIVAAMGLLALIMGGVGIAYLGHPAFLGDRHPSRPRARTRAHRLHWAGVPTLYLIGVGAALVTSIVAGLYPSLEAAQLEPLETLRLG